MNTKKKRKIALKCYILGDTFHVCTIEITIPLYDDLPTMYCPNIAFILQFDIICTLKVPFLEERFQVEQKLSEISVFSVQFINGFRQA